jgi:hypothetical protein
LRWWFSSSSSVLLYIVALLCIHKKKVAIDHVTLVTLNLTGSVGQPEEVG